MIDVKNVVPTNSQAGGGDALQPAATLPPQLQQQLFDEFASTTPTTPKTESSSIVLPAVLIAVILAGISLYVFSKVKKDPAGPTNS